MDKRERKNGREGRERWSEREEEGGGRVRREGRVVEREMG